MKRLKLPVGIDSFEKLRREGFYYVDKTGLIRDLLGNWGEVNLFTRPRRFGKTLNMSMLKSFFEIGTDKTLFDGLAISKEADLCEKYMGRFPVVFISLKGVDGLTFELATERFRSLIQEEAERLHSSLHDEKLTSFEREMFSRIEKRDLYDEELPDSLKFLSKVLYRHYGQKAILLIDEYDVPLDKAFAHGYYDEMVSLLRGLFGQALKTNDSLYFAVLTGCLRVSKESIFTGLNNFKVLSITDVRFDEHFGFTDAEVKRLLADYDLSDQYAATKEWYDGYRFGNADVYCPWDVINHVDRLCAEPDAQPLAYWINTSGKDLVKRVIDEARIGTAQMEIEKLIAGKSLYKRLDENMTYKDAGARDADLWSLLLMTGYLTTRGKPERGVYELAIPNREVREIYMEQVRSWFERKAAAEASSLSALYAAFEAGDARTIEAALSDQLIETISFHDAYESFYHGFVLALLNACADWQVHSNRETGRGRSDILVERSDRKCGFIVELKSVKKESALEAACQAGLAQIEAKDYAAALRRSRVERVWLYGIAFADKACRVLARQADRA